jgi:SP family general alpha glucoside:H+ symporter-like MFS transporter
MGCVLSFPGSGHELTNCQFQQQVPGNILPLPAFIRQFADTTINGEPAISATTISFFQGFAEISKTIGMFAGGTLMDKIGRK